MKNSDMLNNLYKILRMNIILARANGDLVTEDTIQSFDDAAKKIDEENNNIFEDEIKDLYYDTNSLEEESIRLDKLIDLIDKRLEDRNSLLFDYNEVTGRNLEPLGYIKDEDKVESYRRRLNNIKIYLSNKENISKIEDELVELRSTLDISYKEKREDEDKNIDLEQELLEAFKNALAGTDYSDVVNTVDIDYEIESIKPDVEENLKTLNTFATAYNNLLRAGISNDSEKEYLDYVSGAKRAYYLIKEREILFRIYKVVNDTKSVYDDLFNKRDNLDNLLEERINLRSDMDVIDVDILSDLYTVIEKQNKIIVKEKEIIDSIEELEDTIRFKETRLEELKEDNKSVDILALLREFGIIDTYKSDNIIEEDSIIEEDNYKIDDFKEDNIEVDSTIPNMIVQVKDGYANLNIGFARSKADTVMRRVGRSLGYNPEPKKESIVSFDFGNDVKKEESTVTNNSLSNLNVQDLNLDLKLDNKKVGDPEIDINKPIFPDMESSVKVDSNSVQSIFPDSPNTNNETQPIFPETNTSVLDKDVDKDFWSAEEDKEIFPSALKDKDLTVEKEESGFKLGSPISIGGSDENRN